MRRLYSLFVKENGTWFRLSSAQLPLDSARRIFQNSLLAGTFNGKEMGLRPVKDEPVSYQAQMEYENNRSKMFGS